MAKPATTSKSSKSQNQLIIDIINSQPPGKIDAFLESPQFKSFLLANPGFATTIPDIRARAAARLSLVDFAQADADSRGQVMAKHQIYLLNELQTAADGINQNTLITMPPGHLKSYCGSNLFPAWYMARHPGHELLAISYGGTLADKFSIMTKDTIKNNSNLLGYGIHPDFDARSSWRTTNDCTYRAFGLTGSVTGFRTDLTIIDDPIKDLAEANSEKFRDELWDKFNVEIRTRAKNQHSRIILIQTRWHMDDLAGRIIEREPQDWNIINLPAICDQLPDPIGRQLGEPLWPEQIPLEMLEKQRDRSSSKYWFSLYQQKPIVDGGELYKTDILTNYEHVIADDEYYQRIREDPAWQIEKRVRGWDFSSSITHAGDFTVGARIARTKDGKFIIESVRRIKGGVETVNAFFQDTVKADGKTIENSIPTDPGAAGADAAFYKIKSLPGYYVTTSRETGSKTDRAGPFASQVNIGNVYILQSALSAELREEMTSFPNGKHDDIPDALARAFSLLMIKKPSSRWRSDFSIFNR